MSRILYQILVPIFFCLCAGLADANTELRHNPFSQPTSTESGFPTPGNLQTTETEKLMKWELRATLVAGQNSFANIDGRILKIGDEVEGYRLVSIEEGKVTLSKEGKTKTLTITLMSPGGDQK